MDLRTHSVGRSAAVVYSNTAGTLAHNLWGAGPPPAPTVNSPEVVLVASYAVDDGRYINNGWLQELPDPVTKLTWDNAALMSPLSQKGSALKPAIWCRSPSPKKAFARSRSNANWSSPLSFHQGTLIIQ